MKKVFFSLLITAAVLFAGKASAQIKVGVFDIDYMVQAMPGYAAVDSMVQIYQRDSLGAQYAFMQSEFQRLDSTLKKDSAAKKSGAILQMESDQRQQIGTQLVYWQQLSQRKTNEKTGQLAQPLYVQVVDAYKKVLARKKYSIVLKPQTYEAGFPIENIFISVAKELKLTSLPQEIIVLGDDPDAPAAGSGATKPAGTGTAAKPKQ